MVRTRSDGCTKRNTSPGAGTLAPRGCTTHIHTHNLCAAVFRIFSLALRRLLVEREVGYLGENESYWQFFCQYILNPFEGLTKQYLELIQQDSHEVRLSGHWVFGLEVERISGGIKSQVSLYLQMNSLLQSIQLLSSILSLLVPMLCWSLLANRLLADQ